MAYEFGPAAGRKDQMSSVGLTLMYVGFWAGFLLLFADFG